MDLSLVLRNLQTFQQSTSLRTQQAALISLPVMGKLRELQTVKQLLKNAKDPFIALLSY